MNDVRYGLRRLFSSPGVTAVAVLSLALAIGANSAVFSFIHGALLTPPPFREPERLVLVYERDLKSTTPAALGGNAPPGLLKVSVPNLLDFRDQNRTFEHLVGLGPWKPTLAGEPEAVRVNAAGVNHELFEMLGVKPLLGRTFRPEEDHPDGEKVALLGHALWRERYGGDPKVLGKILRLEGREYSIVGVMPPGFDYPEQTAVWTPLAFQAKDWERGFTMLGALGRLKPGLGVEAAQDDLSALARRFAELYPETSKDRGVWVAGLHEVMTARFRPALLMLWVAVGFVLLIACANVSNLLLSRAVERQREVAIRMAVGADRKRLLRQLLVESLLLALLAAVCGLALAFYGLKVLAPLLAVKLPLLAKVRLDLTVVGFTLAASLVTVVLFSLVPALRGSRPDLTAALKTGGRVGGGASNRALQQVTVVAQVAIAVVLLLGAGLLIKSFNRLMAVDPGFRVEDALAVEINLMPRMSYAEPARTIGFITDLERRVQAMPGVEAVGSTWTLPMAGGGGQAGFLIEGERGGGSAGTEAGEEKMAGIQAVTPGYFSAMGIAVLRGRAFTPSDDAEAPPVVIVNEEAARRYWPGEDPVGKRISFEIDFGPAGQLAPAAREVVGVVASVRQTGLDKELAPEVYFPNYQAVWRWNTMVVHGANAASLAPAIRREIRSMDPGLALGRVQPVEQFMDDSVVQQRLSTWLLTAFSVIALVLAAIGVYGVLSYSVTQQTRDIGIRLALGARRGSVMSMILSRAMALTLAGVILGVAAGVALTRYLTSLLFNVHNLDTAVFVGVPLVLILVTLVASYLPARRATHIDPLRAIRTE